jgi:hypothetical protein
MTKPRKLPNQQIHEFQMDWGSRHVGWTFLSVLKLECFRTDKNVHPTSYNEFVVTAFMLCPQKIKYFAIIFLLFSSFFNNFIY